MGLILYTPGVHFLCIFDYTLPLWDWYWNTYLTVFFFLQDHHYTLPLWDWYFEVAICFLNFVFCIHVSPYQYGVDTFRLQQSSLPMPKHHQITPYHYGIKSKSHLTKRKTVRWLLCYRTRFIVSPQSPGVIKTLNSHGNKHHGSHSDLLFIPV